MGVTLTPSQLKYPSPGRKTACSCLRQMAIRDCLVLGVSHHYLWGTKRPPMLFLPPNLIHGNQYCSLVTRLAPQRYGSAKKYDSVWSFDESCSINFVMEPHHHPHGFQGDHGGQGGLGIPGGQGVQA